MADEMGKVAIVGVPLDLGGNRRGVDMGPSAVRLTSLATRIRMLGYDVVDTGDVDVPLPEECSIGDPKKKYAQEIGEVCRALAVRVQAALKEGRLPVTLGGDHSLAMGSIAGVAAHFREKSERVGLLWFDAHGDMNTPESTNSGNVHGMPLAHVLGMGDESLASIGGWKPKVLAANACLIGIRDLDEREKKLIAQSGIHVFTMKDIDRHGVSHVIDEAMEAASRGTAGIHVSFDVDAIDPSEALGVGTPKKGGLTYREAHLCLEIVADSKLLTSLDLVEINPILDTRNTTGELGAELILSALGKRIY
jgi:arginase